LTEFLAGLSAFAAWVRDNWAWISGLLFMVATILNSASEHFTKQEGVKRTLLWLAEMFSFISSKGVAPKLKLPFISRPPTEEPAPEIKE